VLRDDSPTAPPARRARRALVASTGAAATAVTLLTPATLDAARGAAADLSALVAAAALGLAWVVVVRLLAATVAVLASALPGVSGTLAGRVAHRVSPRFARSTVRIACSLAVAGTPLAGSAVAFADPPHPPAVTRSVPGSTVRLVAAPVVPVLDRQVTPPLPQDRQVTQPAPRRVVVVRPGDTLWAIAARELGPRATDAQVAAAWPAWYATNAEVIGPDAGTIRPGQRLHVPDTSSPTTRAAS
jgi:resuscitation-promoting factor RpfA